MGWIKTLNAWRGAGMAEAAAPNAAPGSTTPPMPVDADTGDRPWGCGWLDSSLDLRQGLAVIEHAGIDLGLALELMLVPEGQALQ